MDVINAINNVPTALTLTLTLTPSTLYLLTYLTPTRHQVPTGPGDKPITPVVMEKIEFL